MSKVRLHAVRSNVLKNEVEACLTHLITTCEKYKDEDKDAKEILEVFEKHPKVLVIVTAHAITYTLTHKEYIPTIKLEATVDESGEITSVKPDRPDYLA